jgi:hypothetical protein
MISDNEMASLIKGAADEGQFDLMSTDEMVNIYNHGCRLVQERPFDEELLVAVDKFEFAIKKHGGILPAMPESWQNSIADYHEFTIKKKKPQRKILWRIIFGILWFIPIYLATNIIIGGIVGAIAGATTHNAAAGYSAGREVSANFFQKYGTLVFPLQIFLTAALSFLGLLPGTGKYKKY